MTPRALATGLVALAFTAPLAALAQPGVRVPKATRPAPAAAAAPAAVRAPAAPATAPSTPAPATQRQADFIVAVVNAEPVTNNEVRARLARVQRQLSRSNAGIPPLDVLAHEVMEQLIVEKAQMQLAKEGGITVDELAIDQAAQNIARRNEVSEREMYQHLAQDGVSREQFRQELRMQLTVQRLREREVDHRVRVSEPEIDQFLREQSPGGSAVQAEINLANILIEVPEGASDAKVAELQARAQQVADKARAGGDFAALAREYSDAPGARDTGGAMGLRPADRYPELFVQATAALAVGGVTGPVRSGAGFHVLKLLAKGQGGMPSSVVQSHARHILLRTSAQLTEAAAAAQLADYRRRILAGQADFAQLAREHSQDGSAKQGGDLGWVNPGSFVPEFEEAMDALQKGDISPPVVSRFGVHLIQLIERREQRLNQREQRELARQGVRMKKMEEAYATWVQELRGRAYVEYRDPPQ